jgi:hypothetical protein
MTLPKFTAEASLYKSNTPYSVVSQGITSTLAIVIPQMSPYPGCPGCRFRCYINYRNNSDLNQLTYCLDDCPCGD